MANEKKDYIRSIRMTPTVRDFIEQQDGEGFNQKFENLVVYCSQALPKLQAKIATKEKALRQMDRDILERRELLAQLQQLETQVNRTMQYLVTHDVADRRAAPGEGELQRLA